MAPSPGACGRIAQARPAQGARHEREIRRVGCPLVIPAGASSAAGTSRTADRFFLDAAALRAARGSTRRPPSPAHKGWMACPMSLQIFSAAAGKHSPLPLRKSVRALRLPRTTDLRVALHGRQRSHRRSEFAGSRRERMIRPRIRGFVSSTLARPWALNIGQAGIRPVLH